MAAFEPRSRQSVRPAIDGLQSLCSVVRLPLSPRRCPALPNDDDPCIKENLACSCLMSDEVMSDDSPADGRAALNYRRMS